MMFPMVLPVPRTSTSFGAGFPPCFLWHTGSASMASGLRAGAFPSKVTVPVMVARRQRRPASPTPRPAQPPATTCSLSRACSGPWSSQTSSPCRHVDAALCIRPSSGPTLHRIPASGQPSHSLATARPFRALRRAGSSDLRRSRRPAIRQASGRAVERAPAVASASSPPPRSSPPMATSAATSRADGRSPSGWSVGMTCQ